MVKNHVLLVVDGWFSLGPQDRNDRSFSISHLVSTLKSSTNPRIFLDTAHRDGSLDATIYGKFKFDDPEIKQTLDKYDQIWLLAYNGPNSADPKGTKFKFPITPSELRVIAEYMENGGGILASGDHESVGSYMCGQIPRVRTMRKWYSATDRDKPKEAPGNWPIDGPTRADTLQKDVRGEFAFTNQSDDIPQPLQVVPVPPNNGPHELLVLDEFPGRVLDHFPDHFHEGEVLGYGGVEASKPWAIDATLDYEGKRFVEYPSKDGHQELPQIIAKGHCIEGHTTTVEEGKGCDSGFTSDMVPTQGKDINTLSVYDGWKVGVGRVLTDSSFHHFTDLNVIGDPCATEEKILGLGSKNLRDMNQFYVNCVKWLARREVSAS